MILKSMAHAVTSVFGCRHDRLSRPFTIQSQSYMVCLECGRKVFYSTEQMRRLSRREVRRLHIAAAVAPRSAPAAAEIPAADIPFAA